MEMKEKYTYSNSNDLYYIGSEMNKINDKFEGPISESDDKELPFQGLSGYLASFRPITEEYEDNKSIASDDGDDHMNDILSKYIDKLDRDQSDLREDIRQSNRENKENVQNSEDRITKLIERNIQESQESIRESQKNTRRLEKKIDDNYERLENKLDETKKDIRNMSITTNFGIATMVLATIALAITVIIAIVQII